MGSRKEKLTRRQREILDHIKKFTNKQGYPPSRSDIQEHFGFRSPNAVTDFLAILQKKGYVEITPSTARGIKVIK